MIKFCQKCYENNSEFFPAGYSGFYKDELEFCPVKDENGVPHGCKFINIDFPNMDLYTLRDISNSKPFIDAMINLYQTDIIEYELKMSQFRQQLEGQKQAQDNRPKCPTCQSTNIAKIDGLERAGSIAVFGLFSKKINKTFKCKNCGHTW